MNPKRQEIIDKHLSKGRTEEEILFAFGNVGANESQLAEVESYIKKKVQAIPRFQVQDFRNDLRYRNL